MDPRKSEDGCTYPDHERGIYNEIIRINDNLNELIELLRLHLSNTLKDNRSVNK